MSRSTKGLLWAAVALLVATAGVAYVYFRPGDLFVAVVTVTDSETGEPVEGATVDGLFFRPGLGSPPPRPSDIHRAQTNRSGRAVLTTSEYTYIPRRWHYEVHPGMGMVRASAPGYGVSKVVVPQSIDFFRIGPLVQNTRVRYPVSLDPAPETPRTTQNP